MSFPDEPTLNKGFLHAPSVLSKLHPPLVVHDALRSVGANRVILGVFFLFYCPASGAALPNGHGIKREDSKGSLNSEGATGSPDQCENVMYLGLERMAFTAPECGLCAGCFR